MYPPTVPKSRPRQGIGHPPPTAGTGDTEPGDEMYSKLTHYRIPATVHLSPLTVKSLLWRHRNCTPGDSPIPSPASCNARRQLLLIHHQNGWTWPIPRPDEPSRSNPNPIARSEQWREQPPPP
ncbi:hypothetical protein [Nocardia huaxiensis]|uniref:hypothetical protein n=1 Tax=Nocardia huaxiensis TaxID=2755382 RepID=UPI001C67A151|nr:hypothetical protein [Nocardia huaxiensis]